MSSNSAIDVSYSAIADVGETLVELLWNNMHIPSIPDIHSIVLASPGEIDINEDVRLSLFLYQIIENVFLKNQERQIKSPTTLRFPPIALDLYYMLTSYPSGKQDLTERTKEEHTVLGKAIQILNDNAVLAGSVLKGSLATSSNDLHVTQVPLSLDEMTKMWTSFPGKPFRTSVCFVVTPVLIDSTREYSVQRVTSKQADTDLIAP